MDQKTIKEYLRALEHITGFMRTLLEEELKTPVSPKEERERLTEITELRMLAKSEKWPQAVPEDLICGDDEDQKLARAAGILSDFIKTNVTNKKLLDLGCGEGHVPYVAANLIGSQIAVGYDTQNQSWDKLEKIEGLIFTTDWKEVINKGPYDAILINDVIDHTSENVLIKAREVLEDKGKIFIRFHPWASRHGNHLYKKLNRAYLHLVFTEDELYGMGLKSMPTNQWQNPLVVYHDLIKEANLKIMHEETVKHPIELFFTHEAPVLRRIKEKFQNKFPRDIMELQFVDMILTA